MYPYQVEQDVYCYQGTTVLKNLPDIRDPAVLEQFELEMTTLRAEEPFPEGAFDCHHYRLVHHHLFQDVYRWAGRDRTVRTAKGGNWFCFPENIKTQMKSVFAKLGHEAFQPGAAPGDFLSASADFLAELNAVHPFREGNGRAQLAFLDLVGVRAEHPFEFRRIARESFMPAMITSFSGNIAPLRAELESSTFSAPTARPCRSWDPISV